MTGCSTAAGADCIRDGKIDFVRFVIWCTLVWATDSFIIMSMSKQQHILTRTEHLDRVELGLTAREMKDFLTDGQTCHRAAASSSEVIFWLAPSQNSRFQLIPAGHIPLRQSVTEIMLLLHSFYEVSFACSGWCFGLGTQASCGSGNTLYNMKWRFSFLSSIMLPNTNSQTNY